MDIKIGQLVESWGRGFGRIVSINSDCVLNWIANVSFSGEEFIYTQADFENLEFNKADNCWYSKWRG
jgi:hypothetical protein